MKKKLEKKIDDSFKSFFCSSVFLCGLFILSFIFFNIVLSSTLYIFKVSILKSYVIISGVFSICLILFILYKYKMLSVKYWYVSLMSIVLPILLIMFSVYANGKIYDYTYDGNSYHKSTVGLLKEGWNPVYEGMEDFDKKNNIIDVKSNSYLWGNHYAKGSHIFAANVYAFTDNIESGKAINTLSIIVLFCFSFSFLLYNKKTFFFSLLFSCCLITYPVVCAQYLTFYVDLLLYIYLILTLFFFFFIEKTKDNLNPVMASKDIGILFFVFSLVILINIKFTAFAYGGIFCLGYYIWYFIRLRKKELDKKFFWKFTAAAAVSVVIGVFLVGLSVYPKNFKDHGSPFYPLMGKGKVDIMTANSPDYFKEKSTIEKFAIGTFSKVANISEFSGAEAEYKMPFLVYDTEIDVLYGCDLRISGNGVLFSGILIISLIILLVLVKKVYKSNKELFWLTIIPLSITFVMIFCISESWWARYFPQLYFFVLAAILYFNEVYKTNKSIYIFIYLVLLNNLLFFFAGTNNSLEYSRDVNSQITSFKETVLTDKKCVPEIYTDSFHGAIFNVFDKLSDYKINQIKDIDEFNPNDFNKLIDSYVVWRCE